MLRSTVLFTALALVIAGSPLGSQTTQPKPQPPAKPASDPTVVEAVSVQPPRPPNAQLTNIRIELTITDQRGTAPAAPKTVSMLVADRFAGRIRTSGDVRVGNTFRPITLNVDATPEILRDGRVRVMVNLEYRAQLAEGSAEDNQPSTVVESFSVILDDGKPLLVTQSADPASDRKVRIDLRASIVK